jgi:hypothetical protein
VLERTVARLRRPARRPAASLDAAAGLPEVAFRQVVDERLRFLERQLDEVKTRVNGLLFLLAGTVAAQLILRLVA